MARKKGYTQRIGPDGHWHQIKKTYELIKVPIKKAKKKCGSANELRKYKNSPEVRRIWRENLRRRRRNEAL